jgi:hypothetical protein
MAVLSAFGALAFLLAGIGLYGTLTYLVQLRTPEISIRIALGASRAPSGGRSYGKDCCTLSQLLRSARVHQHYSCV